MRIFQTYELPCFQLIDLSIQSRRLHPQDTVQTETAAQRGEWSDTDPTDLTQAPYI